MGAARACQDLVSIAKFLGFAPQHLFYLVKNPEAHYINIQIPKRSDPSLLRDISIPSSELKGVQRAIAKKILADIEIGENVYSYIRGRSIVDAARRFCPAKAVLNIDIKDFFPSITTNRVFGLFRSYGFNEIASHILCRLTTANGILVQGSPTSPAISNIIMKNLDLRFANLSESWEVEYIRYSDDLFFFKEKNFNHPRFSVLVYSILQDGGFLPNQGKTKYHPKGLPRITLGLLTHGDLPRIPGSQRRRYRALFFKASRNINWAFGQMAYLRGILEWYKCVYGRDDVFNQYKSTLDKVDRLRFHEAYKSK